ncbi:hypothetical protein V8F33_007309 [Rhypophila sp. PSN 637]
MLKSSPSFNIVHQIRDMYTRYPVLLCIERFFGLHKCSPPPAGAVHLYVYLMLSVFSRMRGQDWTGRAVSARQTRRDQLGSLEVTREMTPAELLPPRSMSSKPMSAGTGPYPCPCPNPLSSHALVSPLSAFRCSKLQRLPRGSCAQCALGEEKLGMGVPVWLEGVGESECVPELASTLHSRAAGHTQPSLSRFFQAGTLAT